jgi:membrane protein DedA with SNARE-associated domain
VPGETVLLVGGFYARAGSLNLWLVIASATLAAMFGDNMGYLLGRRSGRRIVTRFGKYLLINDARLAAAEGFYERRGAITVFLARWTAGLRIAGAWTAGIVRLPWWRFFVWNALGCLTWATGVSVLGYALGASYEQGAKYLGYVGVGIVALAVVVIAAVYVRRRHLRKPPAAADTPK